MTYGPQETVIGNIVQGGVSGRIKNRNMFKLTLVILPINIIFSLHACSETLQGLRRLCLNELHKEYCVKTKLIALD